MENFFKNTFIGTIITYFVLGIFNLIRFIIFHYYFNMPEIIKTVQAKTIDEYDSLYEFASQYYHCGYMENSIKIQIYILIFSIIIGLIYGIMKNIKSKKEMAK